LGSGNTGSFIVTGTGRLGATDGGEVDFTGNIIANHDTSGTKATFRNLTASPTLGATIKLSGLNNTYRGGSDIGPSLTLVSGLSTSTHVLGYGPIILAGGTLSLRGQQAHGTQNTGIVTNAGFNQKIIVPVGATYASAATTSTIDGSNVLFQNGYTSSNGSNASANFPGLNDSGLYTSEFNPDVKFQLQPYTSNTALQFQNGQNSAGILSLATPGAYKTINYLEHE